MNSSSGLNEGTGLGLPVVNVGSRQSARERGAQLIDGESNCETPSATIR